MLRFRFLLPVVASLGLAGAASAAPVVTGPYSSLGQYQSALGSIGLAGSDRLATAIIRMGNNLGTSNGWTAGWEAGLFVPAPAAGQGTPGNTVWTSGTPVGFTLTRVGSTLTFTVGTFYTGSWTDGAVLGINTLGIQAESQATGTRPNGTTIAFNSMTYTDLSFTPPAIIPGQSVSSGQTDGYVGQIISSIASGDFSLTGSVTLEFTPGQLPDAGQLNLRIAAFQSTSGGIPTVVPAPAALGLLALGLLGLVGVAARRPA